ncbi:Stp1/IreP family PP2C-type Ser/Thr phosphatase [Anaerocolumna sp. AGMB13020]|uniref:Stp1/IreP family PP2C-type Ser/Thr phosphatase n=1 Tax=Anaerocolumna sp. AGMB13020 TaxID=3081750 RepID=UPI00295527D9|nr:Stp1/IreP family PP2C-type Ser/Thr phosphatase [Anaerocolumna sp. AGMB13020]WOO36498.1 Stp1/IreP family PP2C-type Ser/Thr phosphatase [Anaerocolumna sp. AGMB13020]
MKSFSITDTGIARLVNQDYVYANEDGIGELPNLFIVADGMGGHNAGDYASRFCVETFIEIIEKTEVSQPVGAMSQGILLTNERLLKEADSKPELQGMGTTFVVATVINNNLYVANVGDSRLYLIRNKNIRQITEDHSLVEEMVRNGEIERDKARFHPNKNIITRAIGAGESVIPDYFEVELCPEDVVLMCSDGLSNMMDDLDILSVVNCYNEDLKSACLELINKANENGGKDNISVVMLKL